MAADHFVHLLQVSMPLQVAETIADGALKAGAEAGLLPLTVAVLDVGGHLVVLKRQDGSGNFRADIAIGKAWTARAFDVETKALAKLAQPGDDFYGIHASNDGKVMIFAGGVPIKAGETVIGAVGVSGGTGKQDQGVAEAAAQAFARG